MDMRTGEIATMKEFEERGTPKEFLRPIVRNPKLSHPGNIKTIDPANLSPAVLAMVEKTGRGWVTRNSKCPCGSGKRFKRCCMVKVETGDRGQRYEHWAAYNGKQTRIGWSDEAEGHLARVVKKHPSMSDHRVVDRGKR